MQTFSIDAIGIEHPLLQLSARSSLFQLFNMEYEQWLSKLEFREETVDGM